jgi:hypothetical protein
MFFRHQALNRLAYIVAIAGLLMAAQHAVAWLATTRHQPSDNGLGIVSTHVINRALKADKVMVPKAQGVEPETTQMPRSPGSDIKIGCEQPFGAMVATKSDVAGRCIASTGRLHSILG